MTWFLRAAIDQVTFMSTLFDLNALSSRLRKYASERSFKPEAARLLEQVLIRGEVERGEIAAITGLPERTARRLLNDVIEDGLLASVTPKGPVCLRFPTRSLETLFPRLYPEA